MYKVSAKKAVKPHARLVHYQGHSFLADARAALHFISRVSVVSDPVTLFVLRHMWPGTFNNIIISHNWAVLRPLKYLALAFKFNLHLAQMMSLLWLIIGFSLGVSGVMPTMVVEKYDYPVGYLTRLLNIPLIVFTLLFGGRIVSWIFPRRDPIVFLDKACIHQVDKALMKAGIQKLGAFLRSSDKMLVLLSGIYLKKLWTVYEVASFLSVHDISKLEVVPIMLPFCYVFYISLIYSYQLLIIGVDYFNAPHWLIWLINSVGSMCYMICLRIWARSKAKLQDAIVNFSVHNAQCAVESDREIVYRNIAALQKACGRVPRDATMDQALEAFDEHVRNTLSRQFNEVFGRFAFTHSEYILVGMATTSAIHMDYWAKAGNGMPFREAMGDRCMDFFFDIIVMPGWALFVEFFAGFLLWTPVLGWKDILYAVTANFLGACYGNAAMELQWFWSGRAKTSDSWLIGAYILQATLIIASIPFFRRFGSLHRSKRTAEEQPPQQRQSKGEGHHHHHHHHHSPTNKKGTSPKASTTTMEAVGAGSFDSPLDLDTASLEWLSEGFQEETRSL